MNGMDDVEDMQDMPSKTQDEKPITEDGAPESTGETIDIPKDFLQGTQFREGDELVLKVVAVGDDGIEVAYATAPEKGEPKEKSANEQIDELPEY